MEAGTQDTSTAVRELSLPIYQSKTWLRLLGVLSIVSGALAAITIVGILYAWLPIWVGVLLLQAASSVERAHVSGDKMVLFESLGKLKMYFIIQGVTTLIGLIFAVVALFMTGLGAILGFLTQNY
jgi:hypothetical protein